MRQVYLFLVIVLISGCSYKKENGEWRPMTGEETRVSYARTYLSAARGSCEKAGSFELYTDCIGQRVEPGLDQLNSAKKAKNQAEIVEIPASTGPFYIAPKESIINLF